MPVVAKRGATASRSNTFTRFDVTGVVAKRGATASRSGASRSWIFLSVVAKRGATASRSPEGLRPQGLSVVAKRAATASRTRPILRSKLGIEFVLGPFSELEVLARGKAKAEGSGTEADLPMETAA